MINEKTTGRARWTSWLRSCRLFLYVVILLFVLWNLAGGVFKTCQFFKPDVWDKGMSQLDSFSQPLLAAGLLRQEVDRLFGDYLQARAGKFSVEQSRDRLQNGMPIEAGTNKFSELNPTAADYRAMIDQLETLHAKLQGLDGDLARMLLLVYFEQGSWQKFLDCYLRLMRTEPQSTVILNWGWTALVVSQHCNRTDAVLDELEHLTRVHPELKTARGLKATVEDWKAVRAQNATGTNPPVYSVRLPAEAIPSTPAAFLGSEPKTAPVTKLTPPASSNRR